jgi:hypothetical protein
MGLADCGGKAMRVVHLDEHLELAMLLPANRTFFGDRGLDDTEILLEFRV